jgi:galactose-1-phosphate uridylyltransferase
VLRFFLDLSDTQELARECVIEIRESPPFFLYSTLISRERAQKPTRPRPTRYYDHSQLEEAIALVQAAHPATSMALGPELLRALDLVLERHKAAHHANCPFCPALRDSVTPRPRIYHKPFDGSSEQFVTVPNLYPFSLPHYVTIFPHHTPDLAHLSGADLHGYLETGHELALLIRDKHENDGMWDIINWGPHAAASQSHPHAQRGGIAKKMITEADAEIAACSAAARYLGADPFEDYMSRIRASSLFGFENDFVFIHAPFAPKFPHQVDIICRNPCPNLCELSPDERRVIGESMLGVFHMLYNEAGVTDLNVITHQARFATDKNSGYRLHWHITPRNLSGLGGIEINLNDFVVTVFPEETARLLRAHYSSK